ncbi:MAG: NADH-quinone oxidoreductase subunit L [Bacteroidales bacterium]|nr:NADH-quinone oxidoreductase subunit L [Bacteroidales bacterium]
MNVELSLLILLFLPLVSFLFLSLNGKRLSPALAGMIGIASLSVVTVLSLITAYGYFFEYGSVADVYQKLEPIKYEWLRFNENLSIDLGVLLDPISVVMLVVISFISTMVHIYSWNYMHGEERFQMYYAYLSLFTFSMLGLVVAVNMFQMYIFWELVGVSSFLLIGFYYTKQSAIAAAKKAFIVTRFADLGFLVGILLMSNGAQTLDFGVLIERLSVPSSPFTIAMSTGATFMGMSALAWGLILVFIGGAGKSAMFPLHIWLPDAMEGPTPVSALIHAATMVVAGVFLVARLFPIFAISAPDALEVVAYVGAFTALFAAVIATTQTDIKRVLAYSTISQIAYMMFSLGVAGWGEGHNEGYTASIFHLFTHAFFKALLFLGAGAVIHAVHSNEMADMGGLRKKLPITHYTFLIACLAIAGVPFFSGFYSKEAILSAAFHDNKLIYGVALFTSGLTAFYMFRLYFRIFWYKEAKADHGHGHDNHESHTWAMNIPLILLAIAAFGAGYIPFGHFVSADRSQVELPFHLELAIPPVAVGLIGILIAYMFFVKENVKALNVQQSFGAFYKWAYNKFYIDEIYLFVTKKVLFNLVGRPAAWFDRTIVNGMINGSASITAFSSESIKKIQSGNVQTYALYFLGGVLVVTSLLIYYFQ